MFIFIVFLAYLLHCRLYVGKWFISVVQMAVSALIGWKVLAGLA